MLMVSEHDRKKQQFVKIVGIVGIYGGILLAIVPIIPFLW